MERSRQEIAGAWLLWRGVRGPPASNSSIGLSGPKHRAQASAPKPDKCVVFQAQAPHESPKSRILLYKRRRKGSSFMVATYTFFSCPSDRVAPPSHALSSDRISYGVLMRLLLSTCAYCRRRCFVLPFPLPLPCPYFHFHFHHQWPAVDRLAEPHPLPRRCHPKPSVATPSAFPPPFAPPV